MDNNDSVNNQDISLRDDLLDSIQQIKDDIGDADVVGYVLFAVSRDKDSGKDFGSLVFNAYDVELVMINMTSTISQILQDNIDQERRNKLN